MGGSADPLSALCNGKIRGDKPAVRLRQSVCLSVALVTGGLYFLWNRVYWVTGRLSLGDHTHQVTELYEGSISSFFSSFFQFFYRSSSALHRRSSTEILPDYWGTFCAGVCPKSVFSFLVAAGFEPTSWSLPSRRLNHYPILTPKHVK